MTMKSKLFVATIILALIFPAAGFASEEEVVAEFFVRPLGFAVLVIGSAAYLVAFPVSVVAGGNAKMAEALVKRPYWFTFQREMGEGLSSSQSIPDW